MSAKILKGAEISAEVESEAVERVSRLKGVGIVPGLAVVLVGNNPASEVYVNNKSKACERVGIRSETIRLPEDTDQETLNKMLEELSASSEYHGILLQLPLPAGLDSAKATKHISPEKDVDCFHPVNVGLMELGGNGLIPCTPAGVMRMLKKTGLNLSGLHAVVLGRSHLVGLPLSHLLLRENCTVTVCHSRTKNLSEITRQADILVSAVGKPNLVTGDMIKPGAVVIDVGINRLDGKLCGDVNFNSAEPVAGWLTPVPGGVGKMTVSMLLLNTLYAAEQLVHETC